MVDREALEAKLAEIAQLSTESGLKLSYKLAPVRAKPSTTPFVVEFERDGVLYTASWNRRLLSNGASKVQADWDTNKIASSVTYFDSMNNADDALLRRFGKDFVDFYMMTSTRTFAKPDGSVDVVHNWNTPNAVRLENALEVGPDGWLDKLVDAEKITQAYFGTKDVDNVVKVIEKASGQKPYHWRINNKPRETVERPVVLGLDDGDNWFGINADYGNDGRPARGVAVEQKNFSTSKR